MKKFTSVSYIGLILISCVLILAVIGIPKSGINTSLSGSSFNSDPSAATAVGAGSDDDIAGLCEHLFHECEDQRLDATGTPYDTHTAAQCNPYCHFHQLGSAAYRACIEDCITEHVCTPEFDFCIDDGGPLELLNPYWCAFYQAQKDEVDRNWDECIDQHGPPCLPVHNSCGACRPQDEAVQRDSRLYSWERRVCAILRRPRRVPPQLGFTQDNSLSDESHLK